MALLHVGRPEPARAAARALVLRPDYPEALTNLGAVLQALGPVPGPSHADWGDRVEKIVAALECAYDDPGGMRAHGARAAVVMAELSWRTQMDHLAALLTPLQT